MIQKRKSRLDFGPAGFSCALWKREALFLASPVRFVGRREFRDGCRCSRFRAFATPEAVHFHRYPSISGAISLLADLPDWQLKPSTKCRIRLTHSSVCCNNAFTYIIPQCPYIRSVNISLTLYKRLRIPYDIYSSDAANSRCILQFQKYETVANYRMYQ